MISDFGNIFTNNSTIIKFMQEYDKIIQKAIGQVLYKVRKSKKLKFTIFCYENDIPKTTLYMIEKGKNKAYATSLCKIISALGLSFEEFGILLDKELPENFHNENNLE